MSRGFVQWDRVVVVCEWPGGQCMYPDTRYGTIMRRVSPKEDYYEVLLDGMCCTFYHAKQLRPAAPQTTPFVVARRVEKMEDA